MGKVSQPSNITTRRSDPESPVSTSCTLLGQVNKSPAEVDELLDFEFYEEEERKRQLRNVARERVEKAKSGRISLKSLDKVRSNRPETSSQKNLENNQGTLHSIKKAWENHWSSSMTANELTVELVSKPAFVRRPESLLSNSTNKVPIAPNGNSMERNSSSATAVDRMGQEPGIETIDNSEEVGPSSWNLGRRSTIESRISSLRYTQLNMNGKRSVDFLDMVIQHDKKLKLSHECYNEELHGDTAIREDSEPEAVLSISPLSVDSQNPSNEIEQNERDDPATVGTIPETVTTNSDSPGAALQNPDNPDPSAPTSGEDSVTAARDPEVAGPSNPISPQAVPARDNPVEVARASDTRAKIPDSPPSPLKRKLGQFLEYVPYKQRKFCQKTEAKTPPNTILDEAKPGTSQASDVDNELSNLIETPLDPRLTSETETHTIVHRLTETSSTSTLEPSASDVQLVVPNPDQLQHQVNTPSPTEEKKSILVEGLSRFVFPMPIVEESSQVENFKDLQAQVSILGSSSFIAPGDRVSHPTCNAFEGTAATAEIISEGSVETTQMSSQKISEMVRDSSIPDYLSIPLPEEDSDDFSSEEVLDTTAPQIETSESRDLGIPIHSANGLSTRLSSDSDAIPIRDISSAIDISISSLVPLPVGSDEFDEAIPESTSSESTPEPEVQDNQKDLPQIDCGILRSSDFPVVSEMPTSGIVFAARLIPLPADFDEFGEDVSDLISQFERLSLSEFPLTFFLDGESLPLLGFESLISTSDIAIAAMLPLPPDLDESNGEVSDSLPLESSQQLEIQGGVILRNLEQTEMETLIDKFQGLAIETKSIVAVSDLVAASLLPLPADLEEFEVSDYIYEPEESVVLIYLGCPLSEKLRGVICSYWTRYTFGNKTVMTRRPRKYRSRTKSISRIEQEQVGQESIAQTPKDVLESGSLVSSLPRIAHPILPDSGVRAEPISESELYVLEQRIGSKLLEPQDHEKPKKADELRRRRRFKWTTKFPESGLLFKILDKQPRPKQLLSPGRPAGKVPPDKSKFKPDEGTVAQKFWSRTTAHFQNNYFHQ